MTAGRTAALAVAAAVALLAAQTAHAHGFGARYDLPVPLSYFVAGAAAAVALSFVVVGVFVRSPGTGGAGYPVYRLTGRRWFDLTLGSRPVLLIARAASVLLLALIVATSLFGSHKPLENLSPVFIWIIWWVGAGFVSATVGNVWAAINPWRAVFEWAERALAPRGGFTPLQRYPRSWSLWPAVALFAAFAWVENVYAGAAVPANLGTIIVVYSVIQWTGMLFFGKDAWLRYGDPLSVLFGLFARFAVTEVRVTDARVRRRCELECGGVDCGPCFAAAAPARRGLYLRPPGAGLLRAEHVTTAAAVFVVVALSAVTFDGLKETPAWSAVHRALGPLDAQAVDTIGLFGVPGAFLCLYLAFSWAMGRMSGGAIDAGRAARAFVLSLIPIALAYHFAHYLALLLIQGQAIVPLASDPFGFGWDLFGSSDYRIDIGVINAEAAWFFSVAVIVVGHVAAVLIAHVAALREIPDHAAALRSQYPMLVLMVAYTAVSLWIISQPIIE